MTYTTAPQPEIASRSQAFTRACDIVSNKSSGSKSGSHKVSHIPYIWLAQVPLTTKSSGFVTQPIKSMATMKGSLLSSRPATIGSTKYGPNLERWTDSVNLTNRDWLQVLTVSEPSYLFSYNKFDNIEQNALGDIWRLSFNSYKFCRNFKRWYTVCVSVAKPGSPTNRCGLIWKTFYREKNRYSMTERYFWDS